MAYAGFHIRIAAPRERRFKSVDKKPVAEVVAGRLASERAPGANLARRVL